MRIFFLIFLRFDQLKSDNSLHTVMHINCLPVCLFQQTQSLLQRATYCVVGTTTMGSGLLAISLENVFIAHQGQEAEKNFISICFKRKYKICSLIYSTVLTPKDRRTHDKRPEKQQTNFLMYLQKGQNTQPLLIYADYRFVYFN